VPDPPVIASQRLRCEQVKAASTRRRWPLDWRLCAKLLADQMKTIKMSSQQSDSTAATPQGKLTASELCARLILAGSNGCLRVRLRFTEGYARRGTLTHEQVPSWAGVKQCTLVEALGV
jgi:hypothetical protein